jgi:eukaryotic-like serine/threonine-protein kinase
MAGVRPLRPGASVRSVVAMLVLVLLAGWAGERAGLWPWLDRLGRDPALHAAAEAASPEVLVVAIDDASVQRLGAWPWSRTSLARLVDRLGAAGARTIVLAEPLPGQENALALAELQRLAEVVAVDPSLARHSELPAALSRSQGVLQTDADLARSIAAHGRVLLAATAADLGRTVPGADRRPDVPEDQAWAVGRNDLQPDADGVLRRHALQAPSALSAPGVPSAALAWLAASAHAAAAPAAASAAGSARLRGRDIAIDAGLNLEPILPRATLLTLSAQQLLNPARALPSLTGTLVWVGRTDAEAGGRVLLAGGEAVSRVEAQALLTSALLAGDLLHRPPWSAAAPWGLLVAVALYLAWARSRLSSGTALVVALGLGVALWLAAHLLVRPLHVWVSVAMPAAVLWLGVCGLVAWRRYQPVAAVVPASRADRTDESGFVHSVAPPSMAGALTSPVAHPSATPVALAAPRVSEGAPVDLSISRLMSSSVFAPLPRGDDPQTLPMEYAPETPAGPAARGGPPAAAASRGLRLSHYLLIRELGRGTMGRVYLARDTRDGGPVALKTLTLAQGFEGYALREARERFQREAQAAQRLHHPDIVKVLGAGEEGGLAYISMELLGGHDLTEHIVAGQLLPALEVVSIGARVADALAHAHRQGVIHRDIKPANVMIDPTSNQVKVTDFGVARLLDGSRTRTGLVLGSPAYMAPEQLVGRAVDGRSDLYALGVLLYQLLTGELPMGGASIGELMQAVAHQPAPDLRQKRPDLPESLANVLAILLEKRPELRYRQGDELAGDLRLIAAELQQGSAAGIDFMATVPGTAFTLSSVSPEVLAFMATSVQEVAPTAPPDGPLASGATGGRAQSAAQ